MNDPELREYLISAFQHIQTQRNAISSLLAEVCAVRDSLIELGPKYEDILSRHRQRHVKASAELVGEDLRKLEAIIQRLRDA